MKEVLELLYEINKKGILLWIEDSEKLKYKLLKELEDKNHYFEKIKKNKVQILDILKRSNITSGDYTLPIIYNSGIINPPLSFAQNRLWFIDQYEQGSNAYNIPVLLELKQYSFSALKQSLLKIVSRHEILRTQIKRDDENIFQDIIDLDDISIRVYDNIEDEAALDGLLKQNINLCFRLDDGIPMDISLYHLKDKHFLLVNIHHIAFDGWSFDLFLRELNTLYSHYLNGSKLQLPDISIQYKDFSLWQKNFLVGDKLDSQLKYWEKELDCFESLNLLTDYNRPSLIDYKGGDLKFELPLVLSEKLRLLARDQGVSLYTLMLSAFNLLLFKYSKQNDIVIGTPSASRHYNQIENLMGFFVNTLAIRNKIDFDENFTGFLKRVNSGFIQAQKHQDIPFELIVDHLNIGRDQSSHPIFQVLFSLQNFGENTQKQSNFEVCDVNKYYPIAKYDLSLIVSDNDVITGLFNYSTTLFKSSTIQQMINRYIQVLEQITINPQIKIKDISLLNKKEYAELIYTNNQTDKEYPKTTIHELFEKQAKVTPNNIALVFENKSLTYNELDLLSNQMARYIRSKAKELKADTLIALCFDRSLEMIISILGVLKAGGAYVPIDPVYPDDRIKYILEDTSTKLILSQSHLKEKLNNLIQSDSELLIVDDNKYQDEDNSKLSFNSTPKDLSYVIYTSGTTGKPKGVMIEHSGAVNLNEWYSECYDFNENSSTLIIISFGFDAMHKNVFSTLKTGGKVILSKSGHYDPLYVSDLIYKHKCTILNCVPSAFYPLLDIDKDYKNINSLEYVLLGGEASNKEILKDWIDNNSTKLGNIYGPTECNDIAISYTLEKFSNAKSIPIGKAISNTKLYILDPNLNPVPKGITGELYIAGAGLARGYLNKEDLTKERFIPNPFTSEEDIKNGYTKMYKTGDLVRLLEDNNIEYIGRSDFQVKIRGYRIELGEIENVISKYKDIKQCVVLAKEKNNSKYLVAYYTSENEIKEDKLIKTISKELAEYMVPTAFVKVDEFKLTVNGKLDTKALPEPELRSESYIAPSSEIEIKICDIFKEVLDVEKIGIKDDFFKLGGNSILAISLAHKLSIALSLEIKVVDIFTYKTVSELIEHGLEHETIHIPVVKQEKYPLSFAQQRLYFIEKYEEGSNAYNVPITIKLDKTTDVEIFKKSITSVVNRHDILRTLIKEEDNDIYQELSNEQLYFNEFFFSSQDKLDIQIKEDVNRIFNLNEELPIYVGIYKLKDEIYVLLNIHHIAFDGWSADIFFKEINQYYYHYKDNKKLSLVDLPISYKDFASWQRDYLQGEELDKQLIYWQDKLEGIEALGLQSDYQRTQLIDYEGEYYEKILDDKLSQDLIDLAQDKGVSLYTLLLSAFNILLSKYSNGDDIVIGSPSASRHYKQIEDIIGFFVNTLAIRTILDKDKSFNSLLSQVEQSVIEAQSHQDIPFEYLVDNLNIEREKSRHPIFDVLFSFQNFADQNSNGFFSIYNSNSYKIAKFDLELFVSGDKNQSLQIGFNYTTSLFKSSTIEQMLKRYIQILEQITINPEVLIKDISLLDKEEYIELICKNNQTDKEHPKTTVHEFFMKQAKATPDNIALVFEDKELSYKELDELSNQMARYIHTNIKIQKDTPIVLCLDKTFDLIISILGVLKAGGAYVPIDSAYPDDRIKYILDDTDTKLILTQSYLKDKLENITKKPLLEVDRCEYKKEDINPLEIKSSPNDLVYIIYTSGTTGKPKGVMVEHLSVVGLVKENNYMDINSNDCFFQLSTPVFDAATFEIWGALLNGAKLLMVRNTNELVSNLPLFKDTLFKYKVSILWLTKTLYDLLYLKDDSLFKSIDYLLTGGEALSPEIIKQNIKNPNRAKHIINCYGPTETTTFASTYNCDIPFNSTVPIGKALSNKRLYILDENLNPVPKGIIGELYIAGVGLARGYLNKQEQTKEKFITNPFASEEDIKNGYTRMYKTGDIVRLLDDNNIEYIGRTDFQVKIRGYRIELCEIESVISKYEDIKQCVVLAKEKNNSKYLVAYYRSKNNINEEMLIKTISKELAEYMMPTVFVKVDEFKLTVNGKLDTKALPEPELKGESFIAPSTKIEKELSVIFKEVLNVDQVGVKDDFFKLGGNSILAISLAHKLSNALSLEIKVADIFNYKNISELIKHGLNHDDINIPIVQKDKYPLSFAQQRLYFIEKYEQGSNAYNIPITIKLNKTTDMEIFKKAITAVVNRHDILRTLIKEDGTKAYQELSQEPLQFNEYIYPSKTKLDNKLKQDVNRVFNLSEELPIHVSIYELKDEIYVLINIHHIAFDGWSMDIFFKELNGYYEYYKDNKKLNLPKLTIGYKDFASWQRDYLKEEELDKQMAYWRNKLEDIQTLELVADYQRPKMLSYKGDFYKTTLDDELSSKIRRLAKQQGVTLYTLLLGAFNILLSKYSNQDDIVVGTPSANRHFKQIENIIGFFVNTLAIRTKIEDKYSFKELLKDLNSNVLEAQSNQDVPFEYLVDNLNIARDLSRHPIFDILFSFQNFGSKIDNKLYNIHKEEFYKIAKFDLELFILEDENERLDLGFNYSSSLFNISTIKTMAQRYIQVLEQIVSNPDISIKDISLLNKQEYIELIQTNNQNQKSYVKDTITNIFEIQAKKTPNNIALVFDEKSLTYKELDLLSNQMARYIKEEIKDLKADTLIALYLDRSLEMIISILGVLKAGAAYVPIDPNYPDNRVKYILEDCNTNLVLTQNHLQKKINNLVDEKVNIIFADGEKYKTQSDSELFHNIKENDLAYVIYTSGTTGKPKGVMIEHNNVNRLFKSTQNLYNFTDKDTWMIFHSYVFDFSVWEIWGALFYGGKLFIPSKKELLDTPHLFELMDKHGVSVFNQTPSAFYNFISVAKNKNRLLSSLRYVIFGGEALNPIQIKPWFDMYGYNTPKLVNMYGITETTVHTTYKEIGLDQLSEQSNIGDKLNDLKTYILDTNLNPVPKGITGELYVAGAGLARGYLNKEELTKERFIPNPFASKEDIKNGYTKMYKTGDLVRLLEDNNIEYIGRSDFQVKIRGYRIELGEIESVISKYEDIKQCVVLAKEKNNSKYLVAYYTSENEIKEDKLIKTISKELAEYMVPTAFVKVDEFKLTVNGKLDTKALPEPELRSESYIAPSSELEIKICDIFKEVLSVEKIGIKDDFFKLGGNSILAISLAHKLSITLSLEIKVVDIFTYKTVQEIVGVLIKTKNLDISLDNLYSRSYSSSSSNSFYSSVSKKDDYIKMAIDDTKILDIKKDLIIAKNDSPIKKALLTGASGFLGIYILADLSQRVDLVFCLERAKDEKAGLEKIKNHAQKAGLSIDYSKIKVICGDLSMSNLGISNEIRDTLAKEVDTIIHCGAFVHHLHNYETLRSSNVLSTLDLLQLSLEHKQKSFCFVSTIGATSILSDLDNVPEKIVDNLPFADNGYILSKWVGEKLVAKFSKKYGLDALIVRPGNITGCSQSGFSNFEQNHFWLFNKGCLQLGYYPDIQRGIEMVPVDIVSQSIISLSLASRKGLAVRNLSNPQNINFHEFFKHFNSLGFNINSLDAKEWQNHLKTISSENTLCQIKDFYTGDLSSKDLDIEQTQTISELQSLGINLNIDYTSLLALYIRYLRESKFLLNESTYESEDIACC